MGIPAFTTVGNAAKWCAAAMTARVVVSVKSVRTVNTFGMNKQWQNARIPTVVRGAHGLTHSLSESNTGSNGAMIAPNRLILSNDKRDSNVFGGNKKMFKCPVWIVNSKGKRVKCGRKFATLEQLANHADRAHGGRGREL